MHKLKWPLGINPEMDRHAANAGLPHWCAERHGRHPNPTHSATARRRLGDKHAQNHSSFINRRCRFRPDHYQNGSFLRPLRRHYVKGNAMNNKTIKAKRTTGYAGKPVITLEHICGDYAEFNADELRDMALVLLDIAHDVASDKLRNNETREYRIGE
jgi:hypothetical protein